MSNTPAIQHIIASIFSAQKALRSLAPEFNWSGLGNLLGDYGEHVAIEHYGLIKVSTGSNGYDARHPDGRTVQIKTNHAASQVGFRGEADLLLVLQVHDDGRWSEVYYGPFQTVRLMARYSSRDNKWMVPIQKLREMDTSAP